MVSEGAGQERTSNVKADSYAKDIHLEIKQSMLNRHKKEMIRELPGSSGRGSSTVFSRAALLEAPPALTAHRFFGRGEDDFFLGMDENKGGNTTACGFSLTIFPALLTASQRS
ncbi:hypothetical protein Taro_042521 [Colocasia esculenta]|uniref:Uncharacterized protein n=1 Tax=Colocasia esculenta TaxID=4460 RepID=A0A843WE66_COLES|nr:hypothetical protein [Colocasia esculenta]